MEMYLNKLIDNRNKNLWESLNSEFEIRIEPSFEPNFLSNFKENLITIYVLESDLNPASFTHELLHVYMKKNNRNVGKHLEEKIAEHSSLHYLFSTNLKHHIGNCLEHVKMLPIFVELGYRRVHFISDYMEKKMNNRALRNLKLNYLDRGIINKDAADYFIGKCIAMKSCPNPKFNYNKYYSGLKALDRGLFASLNSFWLDWEDFDVKNIDDDYDVILDNFIEDLINWHSKKTVV